MSVSFALRRVHRAHDPAVPVFAGLDLAVRAGEVVALLGQSGCGKSTLIRLVAGLERADAGEVRLGAARVDGPSSAVGVMFQEPRLLPWRTVADNVAFGLRDDERRRADLGPRVRALLTQVQLAEAAELLPRQLSGGMAQRVALARALARHPDVLLLDEPFGAVDALTRASLQSLLLDVVRSTGATVLLVTHDVEEALRVSQRAVVLAGRPARVVLDRPLPGSAPRVPDAPGLAEAREALLTALASASTGAS